MKATFFVLRRLKPLPTGRPCTVLMQGRQVRLQPSVITAFCILPSAFWIQTRTGSSIRKVVPLGVLSRTLIYPLWSAMMALTMVSPKPVPVFLVEK